MTTRVSLKGLLIASLATAAVLAVAPRAHASETLCDPSYQNCRTPLLALINAETVEIDVGLWFMEDTRYQTAIISRWKAGVDVRILMDTRANATHPINAQIMSAFASAGIPMRKRVASGIEHWKAMVFAGQGTVEFGSANFSPAAFVPVTPYVNYVDETVYFTTEASIVDSFKRKFDDAWIDTGSYANFANASSGLVRHYPAYSVDADLNFPPGQDYATRSVARYNAETRQMDVLMFRITDTRHTDAVINALHRGVKIRMIVDPTEYRSVAKLWDSWNVDRLYVAGVPLRITTHQGVNHGKLVLLYSQLMTIFGSSNWTSPSANSQHEHNYFAKDTYIFDWFEKYFSRRWNSTSETGPFKPLPPDKPVNKHPGNGHSVSTSTAILQWYGGPWAHNYDIYFGTSSTPPLVKANAALGPSTTSTTYQKYTTATLKPHTTYYWKIVGKTMANKTATGSTWYFTTP